jgi:hypothetical protein
MRLVSYEERFRYDAECVDEQGPAEALTRINTGFDTVA